MRARKRAADAEGVDAMDSAVIARTLTQLQALVFVKVMRWKLVLGSVFIGWGGGWEGIIAIRAPVDSRKKDKESDMNPLAKGAF